MAHLVVIVVDSKEDAYKVRETAVRLDHDGLIRLEDSALVVKESYDKVRVHNQINRGTNADASSGALIGLIIGCIFFPLGGFIIGTLGGANLGEMSNISVDQKFIKDVEVAMTPGTSALFLIVRNAHPNAVAAVLKPYRGKVYQTTLYTEAEEAVVREDNDRQYLNG